MLLLDSNSGAGSGPGAEISDGHEVVVYISHESMQTVVVKQECLFNCAYGTFRMKDWIGKKYGSKVRSRSGQGFLYLLAPTPELWTQVLKHRTQILYVADISLIVLTLEIRPGSVVLESGTGSGSLTHALARAAAPTGHVHTFEFHAERAMEAKQEFTRHGLGNLVDVTVRDIEKLGFPDNMHGTANAIFLDLPGPWRVVESAAKCLRGNGLFCSFSPCIEQVQRTCGGLSRAGFFNIRTVECLLRQFEVKSMTLHTEMTSDVPLTTGAKRKRGEDLGQENVPGLQLTTVRPLQLTRGHTGYLTFARRIVEECLPEAEAPAITTE